MRRLPELRAPRINGDLQRPEITIKPRLDLAADLGVTTAALSQTIRIATLGDIDQNSAKFSLSDRQIPIRVSLDRSLAPQPGDDREPAGADHQRRLGAAQGRRRHRLRRRADDGPAQQPAAAHLDRRRSRARPGHRRRVPKIKALPALTEPAGRASSSCSSATPSGRPSCSSTS